MLSIVSSVLEHAFPSLKSMYAIDNNIKTIPFGPIHFSTYTMLKNIYLKKMNKTVLTGKHMSLQIRLVLEPMKGNIPWYTDTLSPILSQADKSDYLWYQEQAFNMFEICQVH